MDRNEWLEFGIREGYCSAPICSTHDGLPQPAMEDVEWEEGGDPCVHIIRPYKDEEERLAVEDNFAPAQWRKTGWLPEGKVSDASK